MQSSWFSRSASSLRLALSRRPELIVFVTLLAILNLPVATGSLSYSLIFLPDAVKHGEWWRLLTHPFVHVTWYHLLLDGVAFLTLYYSLADHRLVRRLAYVLAGGAGGLLLSWAGSPAIATHGLCGMSGIAHGLMAVSALEMVAANPAHSIERRLGLISFGLVVGKALLEALTGQMFFTFLHFGLMGLPVAISHAGGIVGSLTAMFLLQLSRTASRPGSQHAHIANTPGIPNAWSWRERCDWGQVAVRTSQQLQRPK